MEDLIKALLIFQKYIKPDDLAYEYPTACEHDELCVNVNPAIEWCSFPANTKVIAMTTSLQQSLRWRVTTLCLIVLEADMKINKPKLIAALLTLLGVAYLAALVVLTLITDDSDTARPF